MGGVTLENVRRAQIAWASTPVRDRLRVVRALRERIATGARELAEAVPLELPGALHRTVADTLVAEVMPLLEASRFLERDAERILRVRRLGRRGRPVWLSGVESEVERAPWGVVLVLGAANYPLFLAGAQCLQALVAGNAVLWKPAPGTASAVLIFRRWAVECGLAPDLLTVLDERVESGQEAMAAGVDLAVLTGSPETGKAVLHQLAESLTPAAMELSGCDAVFVLPGADLERAAKAIQFGMRFNGSNTCMAPRRVFLVGLGEAAADGFEGRLKSEFAELEPVPLPEKTVALLAGLIEDARAHGAEIAQEGTGNGGSTLILRATPAMRAMRTEIFAPVLSLMRAADLDEALAANLACPYALTAAIFGQEREARAVADRLRVGNVLINDVIVPTADPRIAFGGRGRSGFGVTRGAEGLLAMTTPKTVQVQRSRSTRAYEKTDGRHAEFFAGLAEWLHGGRIRVRWRGLKRLIEAGRKLK